MLNATYLSIWAWLVLSCPVTIKKGLKHIGINLGIEGYALSVAIAVLSALLVCLPLNA